MQVGRLRAQGAIVLSKTNMAEFALESLESRGSLSGQVLNPYDLSRTPAGAHLRAEGV